MNGLVGRVFLVWTVSSSFHNKIKVTRMCHGSFHKLWMTSPSSQRSKSGPKNFKIDVTILLVKSKGETVLLNVNT